MKDKDDTIREILETPVAGHYDLIVAGAGPAGVSAAITAGRLGVRVLLVEQGHAVGGMATIGLMSHWTGAAEGPLYREILDRSTQPEDEECYPSPATINPDKLTLVLLEMLDEANVHLLLYTVVAAPLMDGDRVVGVITESKSGRQAWRAGVVIDASGDGDVAARAGAEFVKGREGDARMQPVTLMFKIGGVDYQRAVFPGSFETNTEIPLGKIQDLGRKTLAHPAGHVLLYRSSLPGIVTVNMTNQIDVDGTKTEDLTRAEIACRRQIREIVAFLRGTVPGYEHCYLIRTASFLGIRETRHFRGRYTLTPEDIVEGRVFEDWIATRCSFNFDIHNVEGAGLDRHGAQKHFVSKGKYTIPYRCLIPMGVEGLILAGRSISGTHKAHSSYRAMPICVNMGQGAAAAAVVAIRDQVLPSQIDIRKAQKLLADMGVEV